MDIALNAFISYTKYEQNEYQDTAQMHYKNIGQVKKDFENVFFLACVQTLSFLACVLNHFSLRADSTVFNSGPLFHYSYLSVELN